MLHGLLQIIYSSIHIGASQDAAVREQADLAGIRLLQFVQERGEAVILLLEGLPVLGGDMDPVVKPKPGIGIGSDLVPTLHLPLPEIQFHQPLLLPGIRETAKLCQTDTTNQRTGVNSIEHQSFQLTAHRLRLFGEALIQRDIRLPIRETGRDLDRCVPH